MIFILEAKEYSSQVYALSTKKLRISQNLLLDLKLTIFDKVLKTREGLNRFYPIGNFDYYFDMGFYSSLRNH